MRAEIKSAEEASALSTSSTRTAMRFLATSTTSDGRTLSVQTTAHFQPDPRSYALAPTIFFLARVRSGLYLQQVLGHNPCGKRNHCPLRRRGNRSSRHV